MAGACALILQADTSLSPVGLRERLWSTAYGVTSPDTLYGYGIVNAAKAAGFDTASIQNQKKILAFPNPFGEHLCIYVKTLQSSKVKFSIFNVAGEKILESSPTLYDSEKFIFFWEGRNKKNEEIVPGVYLVKIDINNDSELIKLFKNR